MRRARPFTRALELALWLLALAATVAALFVYLSWRAELSAGRQTRAAETRQAEKLR